jgi:hypothetical protein
VSIIFSLVETAVFKHIQAGQIVVDQNLSPNSFIEAIAIPRPVAHPDNRTGHHKNHPEVQKPTGAEHQ